MELNEAIRRAEEKAKEIRKANEEMPTDCKLSEELCECAKEHEQLAEWLTELKERREADRWIPVSEKLPEEKINPYTTDFDEVLCTTDWGDVQAFKFGTPIIHHKPHFWLGGAIMDEHIIAWQYKPEPYESEDR